MVQQIYIYLYGFPGASEVKAIACKERDPGSIPGSGRSPGEGSGNPLQYSCMENPMDRGAWWVTVYGVAKSRTRLSDFIRIYIYIYGLQNSLFSQCSICGTVTNCHLFFTLFVRILLLHCLPFQRIACLVLVCSGAQSCLTLCHLMDCRPPSFPIHGIFFRQE